MVDVFTASTHDHILFFTDTGKVYRKKGYQIPESGKTAKGTNLINILQIEQGERVQAMLHYRETGEEQLYLMMVTRNGTVKRLPVEALKNLRNNGIRALTMDEGDQLVSVRETDGSQKILIATHDGMAVVFDENDVRPMGRSAMGVRGIRLREGDYVVGAARAREGKSVLTITEKGYGKRTPVEEYRITNRGGLGIKNYQITDKTGKIVGVQGGGRHRGPAADDPVRYPDPDAGGEHQGDRKPGHSGRDRHALQGRGRPGDLHGAGGA